MTSERTGWPVAMAPERTISAEEAGPLNTSALMVKALNFHGQQLTKIMEDKQVKLMGSVNIRNIDYHDYQKRTRELSFQDRSKRLKLLNFIADRAEQLYTPLTSEEMPDSDPSQSIVDDEDLYAKVPTLPEFLSLSRAEYREQALKIVRPGHVVLCTVLGVKPTGSLVLDCVVNVSSGNMPVAVCRIRAVVPGSEKYEGADVNRKWKPHELCMCLVVEVQQGDMLVTTLNEADLPPALVGRVKLGHRTVSELSAPLRRALQCPDPQSTYEEHLHAAIGFQNPSASLFLAEKYALHRAKRSMGLHMRGGFPEAECATGLRKELQSRLALRQVAKGVAFFKKGEYSEAFQCLNQALDMDPLNVEGLVARGALYANRGNFEKAIHDFEKALNENSEHANARKYMGETLVAQAKAYEDEKDHDKAMEVYRLSLSFVPDNKEALSSIRFLKAMKVGQLQEQDLIKLDDLSIPHRSEKSSALKKKLLALLDEDESGSSSRKKKRRRRHSSSSLSVSSIDSRSSSGKHSRERSRSKRSRSREGSLSPLSKKMQLMTESQAGAAPAPGGGDGSGPSQPAQHAFSNPAPYPTTHAEPVPAGANPYQYGELYPHPMMAGHHVPPPYLDKPPPMPPHSLHMANTKTEEDHAYDEKVRRFLDSLEKDNARKSGAGGRERSPREYRPGMPPAHDFRDHWESRDMGRGTPSLSPESYRDRGRLREREPPGRVPPPRSPPLRAMSPLRGLSPRESAGRMMALRGSPLRAMPPMMPFRGSPVRGERPRGRDRSLERPRESRDVREVHVREVQGRSREPRDRSRERERPSSRERERPSSRDARERDVREKHREGKEGRASPHMERQNSRSGGKSRESREKDDGRKQRARKDSASGKVKKEGVPVKKKKDKLKGHEKEEKEMEKSEKIKRDKKKDSAEKPKKKEKLKSGDVKEGRARSAARERRDSQTSGGRPGSRGDEPRPPGEEAPPPPPAHLPVTRPPPAAPTAPTEVDDFLYGDDLIDTDALGRDDDDDDDERSPDKSRGSAEAKGKEKRNGAAAPGEESKYLSEIEQLRKQVAKLKEKQEKKKKKKKDKKEKKKDVNRGRSSSHSSRSQSPEDRERRRSGGGGGGGAERPPSSERTVRMEGGPSPPPAAASKAAAPAFVAPADELQHAKPWVLNSTAPTPVEETVRTVQPTPPAAGAGTGTGADSVAKMKAVFEEYQSSMRRPEAAAHGRGAKSAGMKICLSQQHQPPPKPEPPKPKPMNSLERAEEVRRKLDAALKDVKSKGINPVQKPPVLRMDLVPEPKPLVKADVPAAAAPDIAHIPMPGQPSAFTAPYTALGQPQVQKVLPFDAYKVSTLRSVSPPPRRSRSRSRSRTRRSRSRSGSRRRRHSRSRSRSWSRGRRSRSRNRRSRSRDRRSRSRSHSHRRYRRSRSPIWPRGRGRGGYVPGRYNWRGQVARGRARGGFERPFRGRFQWKRGAARDRRSRSRSRQRSRSRSSSRSRSRSRSQSRSRSGSGSGSASPAGERDEEPPVPGLETTPANPADVEKLMHGKWSREGAQETRSVADMLSEANK